MLAEQVIQTTGYVGIGFLMFIENLFPPIPSEVVMPFAGFQVNKGEMSFVGVILAGTIGALLGAVAIYYFGYRLGEKRLRQWIDKNGKYLLLSEDEFDSSLETFNDHGKKMVLFGRLIPTIRSIISIPAGVEKMNIPVFLLFTVIGTTVWNLLLAGGGVYLGRNWDRVLGWVDTYSYVIYAILGILLLYYVGSQVKKRMD
ncbi:MAG: DedA family protein [Anaerolineaceae bacterium]|nr:DedA family protein [Anaerolineaceae bacterium]